MNIQLFGSKIKEELLISDNYYNVTDIWKENSIRGTIFNAKSVYINGKIYKVNELNKIIHKNNEESIAKWLKKTFDERLEYLPNIGEEDGVQCADYLFRNEFWDLKELEGMVKEPYRTPSKGKESNLVIL